MTVKEYLDKMEQQLENTLTNNLRKHIPEILERVEEISFEKFIKEGDAVIGFIEFKKIFNKIIEETIQRFSQGTSNGVFQTIEIKNQEQTLVFSVCLN